MYDGTVAVYDLARKSDLPLYKSSTKTGKHTDPVWEVSLLLNIILLFIIIIKCLKNSNIFLMLLFSKG